MTGILTHMVVMAVSGAAVLALVCWAMLSERPPSFVPFIPHPPPDDHGGRTAARPGGRTDGAAQPVAHRDGSDVATERAAGDTADLDVALDDGHEGPQDPSGR